MLERFIERKLFGPICFATVLARTHDGLRDFVVVVSTFFLSRPHSSMILASLFYLEDENVSIHFG